MAEYIDREEVINLLWLFADESCCSIVSDIENLPAADAAPAIHGSWVDKYGNKYANHLYICSICGNKAIWDGVSKDNDGWNLTPYCPQCGAFVK